VLVSEVMLQQTQVARVLDPYRRFLEAFPTSKACAAAGVGAVVRAWAGLGYNRRAVRLHGAACAIVERHGGQVPAGLDELRALPGVGAYTARAVRSFAFELDTGVVDTNVARLLARCVAGRPLRPTAAQQLADRLVAPGQSWVTNQALFDLGAGYCTSRAPRCPTCPLVHLCAWAGGGRPEPDPARTSAGTARPQPAFVGSDRQGRGRLVAALRHGPVPPAELATASGWPGDRPRTERVAAGLVADGLAAWDADGSLVLR
jgi:A/G-specific adenine glycosylase